MFNLKKVLLVFVLVAGVFSFSLMAESQRMEANWAWECSDEKIEFFRYQVDGESGDWTVIPSDVLSVHLDNLDPYETHILYLQASYDGKAWSESITMEAEALLEKDEQYYKMLATQTEVKDTPADNEKSVKEKTVYGYRTNLLISLGASNTISTDSFKFSPFPRANIAIEMQNIIHAGFFGMGLRFDLNSIVSPKEKSWDNFKSWPYWYDSSVDALLMVYLGNEHFDYYIGGGAGYSIINPPLGGSWLNDYAHSLGNWGVFSSAWFVSANTGMRYRFNPLFSLGLEANARYLMPATDKQWDVSADLVFGFSF